MRLDAPFDGAGFSDGAFGEVRRILANLPEPEPQPKPREKNGRLMRQSGQRKTIVAIFDAEKVRRVLRARGLDAVALAERLHMERLPQVFDYGEAKLQAAERIAQAVGVPLAELTLGQRVYLYGAGPRMAARRRAR